MTGMSKLLQEAGAAITQALQAAGHTIVASSTQSGELIIETQRWRVQMWRDPPRQLGRITEINSDRVDTNISGHQIGYRLIAERLSRRCLELHI